MNTVNNQYEDLVRIIDSLIADDSIDNITAGLLITKIRLVRDLTMIESYHKGFNAGLAKVLESI